MEKAIAKRLVRGTVKVREARGYSLAELREVGLDRFKAMESGIQVDKLRRTKHDENVKKLSSTLKGK
jgi:ribosomal protein L13E